MQGLQDNEEAWQQFCDTYRPFLFSLVQKFDLAHEDCEDLTQDVLVKVWRALGKFLYEPSRCDSDLVGECAKYGTQLFGVKTE